MLCYFQPTWLVCTSCWFRIVQLSPLIPRFPIAMAVVPLAKDTSWTPMGLSLKYWPAKRLFVVKLMLFLTEFWSELLKNSAVIWRNWKTSVPWNKWCCMLIWAVVFSVFQLLLSEFGRNWNSLGLLAEFWPEFFKNSDSDGILLEFCWNSIRTLIPTEFYWRSITYVGILSELTRNSGWKSRRLQVMSITYPHILFHPNG